MEGKEGGKESQREEPWSLGLQFGERQSSVTVTVDSLCYHPSPYL